VLTATRLGIVCTDHARHVDDAVADYNLRLLLHCSRGMKEFSSKTTSGGDLGSDVDGKNTGIVWLRAGIGRPWPGAPRFNMPAMATITSTQRASRNRGKICFTEKNWAESDYVSLHAALTPQSRGLYR